MNEKEKEMIEIYKGFVKESVRDIKNKSSVLKSDNLKKMYYKDVAVAILQLIS